MAGTERPMWSAEKRDEWNFEESGTEVEVALGAIAQAAIAAAEGFLAGFPPALLAIAGDLKTAVATFGYSSGTDASNKALVTYDEESKTYASMVITKTQTSKTGMVPGFSATKHTIIVKVKVRVATAKNDSAMDACQKLIDAHVNGGLLPLLEGEAIFGEAPPAPQQQQQQQQQQQDPSPTGPAGPSPSPAAPAGAASQVAGGGVNAADELRRKKQKEELRLKREKEAREQFNPDEDVINEVEELLLMAQECQEKDGYGDREMVDFLNEGLEGEDEEKQGYARAMFFARFGIKCADSAKPGEAKKRVDAAETDSSSLESDIAFVDPRSSAAMQAGLSVHFSRSQGQMNQEEAFEPLSDEFEVRPHGVELAEPVEFFLPFKHDSSSLLCPGTVLLKADPADHAGAHPEPRAWQEVPDAVFERGGVRCRLRSFSFLGIAKCKAFFALTVLHPSAMSGLITLRSTFWSHTSQAAGRTPIGYMKPGKTYVLTVRDMRDHRVSSSVGLTWVCGTWGALVGHKPVQVDMVLDTSSATRRTSAIEFLLGVPADGSTTLPFQQTPISWASADAATPSPPGAGPAPPAVQPLQLPGNGPALPAGQPPLLPAAHAALRSGPLQHPTLISSRFGPSTPEMQARELQQHLRDLGIDARMVCAQPGQDFGRQTTDLLTNAEFMVAMGSANYAEITASVYSSHYELKFAYEHGIPIIPIKLCRDWPPTPPGEAGGANLCRLVFGPSLVRIECYDHWDAAAVARQVVSSIRALGTTTP